MRSDTRRMTTGRRMAELFKAEGVEVVFGGGDLTHMDLQKHAEQLGLKVVGPRHEAAGGFMADAYARMTGRPQVVTGAMGPGVANLIPAAFNAQQEHVPLVFIGAQRQGAIHNAVRRSRFLHASFVPSFAPLCKFTGVITHPSHTDGVVRQALRQATTGTPGPVYIELAWDLQTAEYGYPEPVAPVKYRVVSQRAAQEDIDQAAEWLARAQLPILIGGTGIHLARAHADFERLARLLRCPVLTTYGGLGSLPDSDPQWLPYWFEPGHSAVGESDVILAVGTSIPESMNYGRIRHFEKGEAGRKWICIERDPSAVGINREIDLPLVGDMRAILPPLIAALERHGPFKGPPQLASWRRQHEESKRRREAEVPATNPIHTARLMIEARAAIPDDAVIVHDGGYTLLYQLGYFERRSRDFLWSSKFAHLGTGLPYAIGAQLAVGRDRPVCLITGDASFGFHIMELETAARHSLPIVCIVNYDRLWGAEAAAHVQHIGHMIEVEQAFVRLDRIAEAVGGHGEFVEKTDQIGPAVKRALASRKPSVVQVVTDPQANAFSMPPGHEEFMSWLVGDVPEEMRTALLA